MGEKRLKRVPQSYSLAQNRAERRTSNEGGRPGPRRRHRPKPFVTGEKIYELQTDDSQTLFEISSSSINVLSGNVPFRVIHSFSPPVSRGGKVCDNELIESPATAPGLLPPRKLLCSLLFTRIEGSSVFSTSGQTIGGIEGNVDADVQDNLSFSSIGPGRSVSFPLPLSRGISRN